MERLALPELVSRGASIPTQRVGLLDLCRMIEGHLPEPSPRQPLGVVGLDALLMADEAQARALLQPVRRVLLEGKRYFHWKQIPLVFLVEGTLDGAPGLDGLSLTVAGHKHDLTFFLGNHLKPTLPDSKAWWWSPQVG